MYYFDSSEDLMKKLLSHSDFRVTRKVVEMIAKHLSAMKEAGTFIQIQNMVKLVRDKTSSSRDTS